MPKTLMVKQEEALERQAAHEARTMDEQMRLIRRRPGDSLKERERLIALKEAELHPKGKDKKPKAVKA